MEPRTCPRCGGAIEAEHPQGLCPACLLKDGLQSACASCQATLSEGARFCGRCGVPVPAGSAPPQPDRVRAALEAKLRGQYRLIRLLGRGGMGAVYLARDLALDREVAIKVIEADTGGREVYDRFRREAKTAARLSHPNIVPLHAFGEVEGMPYFVMGFVRGESLAARLRRDGRLAEEEGRRVLAEVADALDHAHRQGVVHRDVKPDNVLLEDESGRAVLTDFGVAKAVGKGDTLTRAGSVLGTPHYMSPEQAAGRADVDARSDLYSVGVMAYAMLAGRLPFEGETAADILRKHLTQEPPPLRSLAPALSDPTVLAVERCLVKDPAARWPDARSLKLALGAVEESQLPDALHAVEGKGVPATVIAVLFLLVLSVILTKDLAPIVAVNAASIALGYVLLLFSLRRQGFSIGQSQAAIWTEPAWWPGWYPRALRRRGNVWDRLPAAARSLRWLAVIFFTYFLVMTVFVVRMRGRSLRGHPFVPITLAFCALVVVLGAVLRARARRELIRKGLGSADVHRVTISVPPSRVSFWARPHIAAVLAPARPEPARRADTPHDQLQSILRHAAELSGPIRPLGAEAAAAGRQLIAAIEEADREIAELTRNLEPGEEERLADKIPALSGEESAPMRELLEKQLELVRRLSARVEEANARRSRRVEMLKTLALHLASLRSRSEKTTTEVRTVSDRVRALCDDIARQERAPMEGTPTLERRI